MSQKLSRLAGLQALKKIGFIVPSSNTALEPVTAGMLHQLRDQVAMYASRITVKSVSLEDKDVGQFDNPKLVDAAQLLDDAGMDAILWNGTSGCWSGKGFAADREFCDMATAATGKPVSTSSLAQLEVFRHFGIKTYGLAVPYVEAPTAQIIQAYGREGVQCVSQARLDETVNTVIGNTSLDRLRQLLRDADSPQAECIVVACTNLPAAIVVDEMEAELGKPIHDSVAVTLWKALRMLGITTPIHGWGQLLRDHPVLVQLEAIMARLHADTAASRITLRIDIPQQNCHVDTVSAESASPGVRPLKLDSSLNQRSLGTVQWLEKHRCMLVQSDCVNAEVPPPQALMNVYGVKAQMLAPLVWGTTVVGWISVHQLGGTREWTAADIATLQAAADQTHALLQKAGWVAAA